MISANENETKRDLPQHMEWAQQTILDHFVPLADLDAFWHSDIPRYIWVWGRVMATDYDYGLGTVEIVLDDGTMERPFYIKAKIYFPKKILLNRKKEQI